MGFPDVYGVSLGYLWGLYRLAMGFPWGFPKKMGGAQM